MKRLRSQGERTSKMRPGMVPEAREHFRRASWARWGQRVMREPWAPKEAGFTLIEVIFVMAIIGILFGLLVSGAHTWRERALVAKARSMIASLETALAMYRADLGEYPVSGNGNLVPALTSGGGPDWQGPYQEFDQSELSGGQVIDPWRRPYEFVSNNGGAPSHNVASFDLSSLGPDGVVSADDITNW